MILPHLLQILADFLRRQVTIDLRGSEVSMTQMMLDGLGWETIFLRHAHGMRNEMKASKQAKSRGPSFRAGNKG